MILGRPNPNPDPAYRIRISRKTLKNTLSHYFEKVKNDPVGLLIIVIIIIIISSSSSSSSSYSSTVIVVTDDDGSRVSIAVIRVSLCVCDSVYVSVRMIKPKRLKSNRQTWHKDNPSRYLSHKQILGQKVKGQGYRVTKCITLRLSTHNETVPHGHLVTRRHNRAGLSY